MPITSQHNLDLLDLTFFSYVRVFMTTDLEGCTHTFYNMMFLQKIEGELGS